MFYTQYTFRHREYTAQDENSNLVLQLAKVQSDFGLWSGSWQTYHLANGESL